MDGIPPCEFAVGSPFKQKVIARATTNAIFRIGLPDISSYKPLRGRAYGPD